jgi:uncharacterized membrane protein
MNEVLTLIYLLNSPSGLTGIIGMSVIFAIMLLFVFKLKPLQKVFKVKQETEAIIWFGLLFAVITILLIRF